MRYFIIIVGIACGVTPWAKIFPDLGVEILTPPSLWIQIFGIGWLCGAIFMMVGGRND